MTPAATLETPAEAPAIRPRVINPRTIALCDVIAMKAEITTVSLPTGGTAAELQTQLAVFKQAVLDCVERIPSTGGEWREREIRQAAVAAVQYERTFPMWKAAAEHEATLKRQRDEAEQARQERIAQEIAEEARLRKIVLFGLEQP